MNTFRKSALSGLGAIVVALSVAVMAAPASAAVPGVGQIPSGRVATVPSALPSDLQAQADEFAQYEPVLLESLQGSDGAQTFDLDLALSRGVPTDLATDFAEGISLAGGTVSGDFIPSQLLSDASSVQALSACAGETRGWVDGFGAHARFDSCDTDTLVSALNIGASYSAIAAILAGFSGEVYAVGGGGLVAALIQASGSSISACAVDGTGVEIAVAGFVCWAQ